MPNTENRVKTAAGGQNVSKVEADFLVSNHGSIFLFTPTNNDADMHIREGVSDEAMWYGGALVVEPRYARDLADQLSSEGFTVE